MTSLRKLTGSELGQEHNAFLRPLLDRAGCKYGGFTEPIDPETLLYEVPVTEETCPRLLEALNDYLDRAEREGGRVVSYVTDPRPIRFQDGKATVHFWLQISEPIAPVTDEGHCILGPARPTAFPRRPIGALASGRAL